VRQHYITLTEQGRKKGPWSKEEDTTLSDLVQKQMEDQDIDDPTKISGWDAIATQMNRSQHSCMKRWYDYTMFKIAPGRRGHTWVKNDRNNLLKRMLAFNARCESEIDWRLLSGSSRDGQWKVGRSCDSLRSHWYSLRALVPDIKNRTFNEAIKWCLDHCDTIIIDPVDTAILESEIEDSDVD
jgi:hypothetical protein